MKRITLPSPLFQGAKVALVAPSGQATAEMLDLGKKILTGWGLKIVVGKHTLTKYEDFYTFAGNDQERRSDLQTALDAPDLQAIICLRGGYGMTRIQDQLSFAKFEEFPKWVVGFSDITALHLQLRNLGFASLHAAMPTQFGWKGIENSLESLRKALFGRFWQLEVKKAPFFRSGQVTAEVIGGNLALLVNALGTASEPDLRNKILFLEEVGEAPYAIDRMLYQLKRSGKLSTLAACVLGSFTHETKEETIQKLLTDFFDEFTFPVAAGFSIGHTAKNEAVIQGGMAHLKIGQEGTALLSFEEQQL